MTTGTKRRRPASASLSPPPPPRQPTRTRRKSTPDAGDGLRCKKRRLDGAETATEAKPTSERTEDARVTKQEMEKVAQKQETQGTKEEEAPQASGKRRRSEDADEEKQAAADEFKSAAPAKKRRVEADEYVSATPTSPPPELPASPPANLSRRHSRTSVASSTSSGFSSFADELSQNHDDDGQEETKEEEEEKPRFPPPAIEIPRHSDNVTLSVEAPVSKENREQELHVACAAGSASSPAANPQSRRQVSLRSIQVTPPPSSRMLDRKNPPPPPKRPKRRYHRQLPAGIVYTRSYPRMALSPLLEPSSPGPSASPQPVFRSLETEFAFAMQDTPETRPRVRPAPRMARGSRRSTRADSGRARRSLDTPTSTMVLRSRQLNPSHTADGGKPENQREREQREAQRRRGE